MRTSSAGFGPGLLRRRTKRLSAEVRRLMGPLVMVCKEKHAKGR
jgi:hypothetical protein